MKETTEIGEGKLFSPGNLRATSDNVNYAKVYLYSRTSKGHFSVTMMCNITHSFLCYPIVDRLLRQRKIHIEIHRRNGAGCEPGSFLNTIMMHDVLSET